MVDEMLREKRERQSEAARAEKNSSTASNNSNLVENPYPIGPAMVTEEELEYLGYAYNHRYGLNYPYQIGYSNIDYGSVGGGIAGVKGISAQAKIKYIDSIDKEYIDYIDININVDAPGHYGMAEVTLSVYSIKIGEEEYGREELSEMLIYNRVDEGSTVIDQKYSINVNDIVIEEGDRVELLIGYSTSVEDTVGGDRIGFGMVGGVYDLVLEWVYEED